MHKLLLAEIVEMVRQRYSEGDCPTVPRPSGETLEDAILDLAAEVDKLTQPAPELNERMNCENCNQVYEREYSNGGKQCFGLVKDTYRDCDVIRACQKHDNGKIFLQDLSPDEAAEMATGYAAVVRTWFSFFYHRPCGTCDQKESDCNGAE
jgi:hypothetical protein